MMYFTNGVKIIIAYNVVPLCDGLSLKLTVPLFALCMRSRPYLKARTYTPIFGEYALESADSEL